MKGKVQFSLDEGVTTLEASAGQIYFTTIGKNCKFCILENAKIVIFRIYNPVVLCENFPIEKLYNIRQYSPECE